VSTTTETPRADAALIDANAGEEMPAEPTRPAIVLIKRLLSDPVGLLGVMIVVALVFGAILAPVISWQNPYDLSQLDFLDSRLAPGSQSGTGTTFLLGSDDQGRDLLSAILFGLRTSLLVGVVSAGIALVIGAAAGLVSAYAGGRVDMLIMRIVDIQLSFPAILIALVLLAILGQGVDKIIFALVVTQWAYYARTIRGSALVERRRAYVDAARCLALPPRKIVFSHILPNCLAPLIVVVTMRIAYAVSLEATLSFLGIGLPITEPSLGLLIANGFKYLMSGDYWISLFPGLALLLLIVGINLIGDTVRDLLNPRMQR
jgi:peptide/nickel transport system permease protein